MVDWWCRAVVKNCCEFIVNQMTDDPQLPAAGLMAQKALWMETDPGNMDVERRGRKISLNAIKRLLDPSVLFYSVSFHCRN